jgi:MSHA biogenesis protein MshN
VHQATPRELSDNEYRKAATSLHQGRTQEAIEGFKAALSLYPGHHGARQALVALLVESKANAEAERLLQEGIKLAPEQIGFAMTLARLQVDRGDGVGAIATLQGSLGYAQASPDYAAFLAALLQRQGRHDQAIEQFQVALKARPGTGVWWLGLAISLQALNRAPEAQEAYRRAKTTSNLNPELTAFADQRLRQLQ